MCVYVSQSIIKVTLVQHLTATRHGFSAFTAGHEQHSCPQKYSPTGAPDMGENCYLKYMRRYFRVGHSTGGTDAELTCH
jgi:hypothetical protein